MSSLEWRYEPVCRWVADSCNGQMWEIRVSESGGFYVMNHPESFLTLEFAKRWCEEREAKIVAARPVQRLAHLCRRRDGDNLDITTWVYDSRCQLMPGVEIIGSAWITEGEFTDD